MISFMDTIAREKEAAAKKKKNHKVQTVLRISPELMAHVKFKARQVDVSVNAYIEEVLKEAVMPQVPKLPKGFEIDPVIKSLSGIIPTKTPARKELDGDPKYAYLYEKYLKV